MSWVTTRMTLSVGSYKSVKKNGFSKWAKVMCHVSPVDPTTGETVTAIGQTVEFWPDDQSVAKLMLLTKDAEEISIDGKEWKRWLFVGDKVPADYKKVFSFMGELAWDVIDFGEDMIKVIKDGNRIIKFVKDDEGKRIVRRTVTYAYWYGPMISPGLTLSKEYREARVRREYEPISAILNLDDEKDNNEGDNGGNDNDEGAA